MKLEKHIRLKILYIRNAAGSNPALPTKFLMQGYTVGVAGQTVNLLSSDSGSATLSPCTI